LIGHPVGFHGLRDVVAYSLTTCVDPRVASAEGDTPMVSEREELHVLPHESTGGWFVQAAGSREALSWHGEAGEAERAARRRAALLGARRIYMHDRYRRVRAIASDVPRR
jgi:hypothetical protein